jgi:alginate O-acetyltransferase complex protein AlgI
VLFNSPEFLFGFLPTILILYFLTPRALKNAILFVASLLFYFVAAGSTAIVLILSVIGNYCIALRIEQSDSSKREWLFVGIIVNLAPLFYYKYIDFGAGALNDILRSVNLNAAIPMLGPLLPVGISFFTFQAISYIVDIYTRRIAAETSLINFGMYHSCFPQLIAGPIVRYEEIASSVRNRRHTVDSVFCGSVQFAFGLAKKVLLADNAGQIADQIFASRYDGIGSALAWLGAAAYTLQIYFDFSGYSDMAIGLGRIFGFKYPENFNQPYRALSITEFWRRWHMTLSRWFKDYVYVPLGGNRNGLPSTLRNLTMVFFLCGLWHGAAYTFIVWGLYHGLLLVLERLGRHWFRGTVPAPIAWGYTIIAVMIGWIIFRSDSLPHAMSFLRTMFRFSTLQPDIDFVLPPDKIVYLIVGAAIACIPFAERFRFSNGEYNFNIVQGACSIAFLVIAAAVMSASNFNPFIYFRF